MPFDALEYVVRPWTTPNAHGQIIIPSAPKSSPERASLTWGGGTFDLPQRTEVSDGVTFEVICCQEELSEKSRTSETKRITQQDNEDNWVDVERPTAVKLKKKHRNSCGDDWGQTSKAEQAISPQLDQYGEAISSGVVSVGDTCAVGWTFDNG
jgi:hypothetical protein